ncbi:hypothetical protein OF829_19015 [Sphingomonas sp. LB-2]|uniref:hypothetical protein n=1 Tax=Sphingomonas caeni TaxID=2984949 RepID=UPI00222E579A|nr:hypothetical protein [Sphingomonas caeni]MCW3849335.1 hypothetical protein [Sphingomonas caeni]
MRSIASALVLAAAFLALSAGLRYAANIDLISDETMKRTVQVVIGLGLAIYSNFTPKQIGPQGSPAIEAWKQKMLRVAGWSMVLAGLTYAALWAFAPLGFAGTASVAVVVTAMVVSLGYAIRCIAACQILSTRGA